MAKKPASRKSAPKKTGPIEHLAQEVEARFLEGAEMATETTSAETNIVLAALGAIEGARDVEPPARSKAAHGKPKTSRPKKR